MNTAKASAPGLDRMLRAADFYRGLGLSLTPLQGKRPVLPVWQRRPPAPEELDKHVRRGSGLGCVHVHSGTATLDADAEEKCVAAALTAAGVDFGELLEGPSTIGNPEHPPKAWFRVPEGYDLNRRVLHWPKRGDPTGREVVLELRAGPVQDVLPPTIHPDTGVPYRWRTPPRHREDLPVMPGPLLGLWLQWERLRPLMEAACPWADPVPPPTDAPATRTSEPHTGPSVIDEWNRQVPASVVLERNGYRPAGSGRWLAPSSETGDPGVVELDGRIYSHHASDPLAGQHSHDSFSVLTVLEHGGDASEAARAAARELGMGIGERNVRVAVAGGAR